jgi:plasmid stabilization system protein ParE
MKRGLKIAPKALKDIQQAADYYRQQQKGLAKRFTDKAYQTIKQIARMPEAASISHGDIRYKVMETYPFIITYRFDDSAINILRVFNTHQDPDTL